MRCHKGSEGCAGEVASSSSHSGVFEKPPANKLMKWIDLWGQFARREDEQARLLNDVSLYRVSASNLEKQQRASLDMRIYDAKREYGRHLLIFQKYTQDDPVIFKKGETVGIFNYCKARHLPITEGGSEIVSGVVHLCTTHSMEISVDESQYKSALKSNSESSTREYSLALVDSRVTSARRTSLLKQIRHKLDRALDQNGCSQDMMFNILMHDQKAPALWKTGKQDLGRARPFLTKLNPSQQEAVKKCIAGHPCYCIHGPPGTGKTVTIVALIRSLVALGRSVLATAPSNTAVDNMMKGLAGDKQNVKMVRLGHPSRVDEALREYVYITEPHDERTTTPPTLFGNDVVFSTCVSAGNEDLNDYLLNNPPFDFVIIDEAGQAIELDCWIPILKGARLIMAGDPMQLPPTVTSQINMHKKRGSSLLSRIMEQHPQIVHMLTTQYRMHPVIMRWSSQAFYSGRLQAAKCCGTRVLVGDGESAVQWIDTHLAEDSCFREDPKREVTPIDTNRRRFKKTFDGSRSNIAEALICIKYLEHLQRKGLNSKKRTQKSIGLISPYREQVLVLKSLVESSEELADLMKQQIDISSVDGFQGQEKDMIILSLVRSNPRHTVGFLNDSRRLNVAMTRAKCLVVIVGDTETVCAHTPVFQNLYEYVKANGRLISPLEFVSIGEVEALRFRRARYTKETLKRQMTTKQISIDSDGHSLEQGSADSDGSTRLPEKPTTSITDDLEEDRVQPPAPKQKRDRSKRNRKVIRDKKSTNRARQRKGFVCQTDSYPQKLQPASAAVASTRFVNNSKKDVAFDKVDVEKVTEMAITTAKSEEVGKLDTTKAKSTSRRRYRMKNRGKFLEGGGIGGTQELKGRTRPRRTKTIKQPNKGAEMGRIDKATLKTNEASRQATEEETLPLEARSHTTKLESRAQGRRIRPTTIRSHIDVSEGRLPSKCQDMGTSTASNQEQLTVRAQDALEAENVSVPRKRECDARETEPVASRNIAMRGTRKTRKSKPEAVRNRKKASIDAPPPSV